ncbi:MAG: polyamine aminopropyltransferase [Blastocatellia bacterium]|nr:polyamine aminopropyltransferase [Blastocatellia bacterium]
MNRPSILFLNVLIIATCGLVYELLAGTLASYVLGDSITQFSLIIGLYLSALGVGAWLSRYITDQLARRFVEIELAVALLGGMSAPILFISFGQLRFFPVFLYGLVFLLGSMVGLEIPLLMRILKDKLEFADLISKVLTFDYLGSLLGSILFPLLLVPKLGLVRTSLLFGLLNAIVGIWATYLLQDMIEKGTSLLRAKAIVVVLLLVVAFIKADTLTSFAEDSLYADEIIYSKTTPYQRIVITRARSGFQLFLNGHLQFSSADEYRYHEALVHPAMLVHHAPKRVLVLGGGDGLALREVLKHSSVTEVVLVDLDPAMTNLSASFSMIAELNGKSFQDPRVKVVNQDAMIWIENSNDKFDTAIIDFPDPNSFSLGKLYTTRFYKLLKQRLLPDATVAIQSTSPLFARSSYWCIVRTIEAAGFMVKPYQTTVPSFGVWGFVLASVKPFQQPQKIGQKFSSSSQLRFLNDETLSGLFIFSSDMSPVPVEINRLDNQTLVRYYEADWKKWE